MDEEHVPMPKFERLNRVLLWLLTLEACYFLVVLATLVTMCAIGLLVPRSSLPAEWSRAIEVATETVVPAVLVPFLVAFLGNVIGAVWALFLALRARAGAGALGRCPGILLNWIYFSGAAWVLGLLCYVLAIELFSSSID